MKSKTEEINKLKEEIEDYKKSFYEIFEMIGFITGIEDSFCDQCYVNNCLATDHHACIEQLKSYFFGK